MIPEYTAAFVLSFLCFICFYCTAITHRLLCHVCYCDACKCLHGLGICVWFYPNKLMMMMMKSATSRAQDNKLRLIGTYCWALFGRLQQPTLAVMRAV